MSTPESPQNRDTPFPINRAHTELTTGHYVELLSQTTEEEHYYLDNFHREVQFFWGVISALVVATSLALYNAEGWQHLALAAGSTFLIVPVTFSMITEIERTYKRFIETIVVRAKLEQCLGLHRPVDHGENASYWNKESILHVGHVKSRQAADDTPITSAEFVELRKSQGLMRVYSKAARTIRHVALAASVLLAVGAAVVAIDDSRPNNDPEVGVEAND